VKYQLEPSTLAVMYFWQSDLRDCKSGEKKQQSVCRSGLPLTSGGLKLEMNCMTTTRLEQNRRRDSADEGRRRILAKNSAINSINTLSASWSRDVNELDTEWASSEMSPSLDEATPWSAIASTCFSSAHQYTVRVVAFS